MRSNVFARTVVACLLMTACDSPTAPQDVSTDSDTIVLTNRFDGTIAPGGASFYSVSTSVAGSVRATLQSLTLPGHPQAVSVPMEIGVGVPRGEGCLVMESVETPPGLITQFVSSVLTPGTYCISVRDPGRLTVTVAFVVSFGLP